MLGEGEEVAVPPPAPAILSLPFDELLPPPHAVNSRAAVAANAVATGTERLFTIGSPGDVS
ncbi:hypothetical protein BIV23_26065 [Streptomyces monashensis]|uniref:Uncharacterized protein n=1 Tax=Streptomyces monashensis TaxID=1678012 RepID=A0A1S2Q516_9ACTN|nr:hypothetical protein BIV23_26065 [Streptomyces monashensis]